MVGKRTNREQYRWAGWALCLLALAWVAYGCGVRDRDGGTDTAADAASPDARSNDRDSMGVPQWVFLSRDLVASARSAPDAPTGDEGASMAAAHSAAWMEALDGLAVAVPQADGGGAEMGDLDAGADVSSARDDAVTPAPPAPVYVAPPPTPYAVLDTSVQLTEAQMVDLLRQAGFDEYTWPSALAVSFCESRWSPNATGGASEKGLFQIHPIHYDSSYDPLSNVLAAYRISSGGYDWSAWSCRP